VTRGADGRSVVGPPKSEAGRRALAVPAVLIELLAEHLDRRGLGPEDREAFVVGTPDGEHLDHSNWLHRVCYPARAKAGLDWLQFHDLRRTNATGLVHESVDLKTHRPGSDTPTPDLRSAHTHRPRLKPTGQQLTPSATDSSAAIGETLAEGSADARDGTGPLNQSAALASGPDPVFL